LEIAPQIRRRSIRAASSRLLETPKLTGIVASVVTGGAVAALVAATQIDKLSPTSLAGLALLLVAATASEAFPVPVGRAPAGATSLATIFIVAAAVLYSWQVATLVGVMTMLGVEAWRRKPAVQAAFNTALYALGGAAAGLVVLLTDSRSPLVTVVAAATFYAVDIGLLAAVIGASRAEAYAGVLRKLVQATFLPLLVMASTTAILVELWCESIAVALLLLPPLVAIAMYQRSLHNAIERQRELDRLKDDFVAVVSHELRTPLATVYGGVETLQRKSLAPEARDRLFVVIRQEATRLAKLVEDVLWASRLGAHRGAVATDAIDPAPIIAAVAASAAAHEPQSVAIVVRSADELARISARPENVERVLTNLVENAVKYSPNGGVVEIDADDTGDSVRFFVRDEGIGVPEEDRERIFEKFTRLDPQMTRGIGGTGLGLYICRELVREMGGEISCIANAGRGTTFSFDIPKAA
jgi:signal transduction histidine kinase